MWLTKKDYTTRKQIFWCLFSVCVEPAGSQCSGTAYIGWFTRWNLNLWSYVQITNRCAFQHARYEEKQVLRWAMVVECPYTLYRLETPHSTQLRSAMRGKSQQQTSSVQYITAFYINFAVRVQTREVLEIDHNTTASHDGTFASTNGRRKQNCYVQMWGTSHLLWGILVHIPQGDIW